MAAGVPAFPDFLQDDGLRLLLFGGKGGVGKTTCAAAAALHLARQQPTRNYLLVSTDPAHSLADCFAGTAPLQNLGLRELDPQECLLRFKLRHEQQLRRIALRGTFLDEADLTQLFDLSTPGLDEIMALLEISALVKDNRHACIVVDTAPAGHTLRLLGLPAIMRQWAATLDTMLAKHRYLAKLYRGTYQKDEVDIYLEQTVADLSELGDLLQSASQCRFVPVMLAETLSIQVTRRLLRELHRLALPVRELVVNRLHPAPACAACAVCAEWIARQNVAINTLTQLFSTHPLWQIPLFLEDLLGTERLLTVWAQARPLAAAAPEPATLSGSPVPVAMPPPATSGHHAAVSHPVPLPAAAIKLLLFAGKGGVGKTTLACATALRLAQERSGQEILLFSIDPAHSLAACLGRVIGPQEVRVAPGLSVIELDAQAEHRHLKQSFADELTGLFAPASGPAGMSLAFDREIMARILDLAPPGLDEVLALTRIVDLVAQGRYDLVVLDTAPTGHLLRFLEMPELIEQWLKAFFALFLKYRQVFWLPRISQLMVALSKRLKAFRRLLVDPQQAALMAVTIPTEMACAETKDLLAACQRLGLAVPLLFVNMLTPAAACPTCAGLSRREAAVLAQHHAAFAGHQLTHVFRQQEPQGLNRLQALGRALYSPPNSAMALLNSA